VLVVRQDSAGDVLLAGPAVRAVAGSGAEVVMLVGRQGRAAAELLPGVSRVVVAPCPWIEAEPGPVDRTLVDGLVDDLAALELTEAVLLTSFHQSPLPTALLLRLAGIRRIAGASVDYPGSLLDVRLRPGEDLDEELPEAERALAIVNAAGYHLPPGDDGRLAVRPPPPAPAQVLTGARPYLVLHPGATVPARAWPPKHCAAAVRALAGAGHRVVVTGGPGERGLTRRVAGRHALDLGGRTDLAGLAGVLAGADVLIAGNTGPAHLAAAVGTPVVSLFAPVVPASRWAPYKVPHVLLGDQQAPCRGTRARACPVPGHPCLASVTVDEVLAAVSRLRRTQPGRTQPGRTQPGRTQPVEGGG
jgi:ADP-heptose:LPS heptosyltransferase